MPRIRKGFTLVELMVAVCILAVGLVGIARSLLNAVSALDYCNSLMNKMAYVDNLMCELQEKVDEKEGYRSDDQAIRDFLQEKINLTKENEIGQLDWSAETSAVSKNMTEFEFRLNWQEGNSGKNLKLVSYLPSPVKKEAEQP